jgi:hypothetical protein
VIIACAPAARKAARRGARTAVLRIGLALAVSWVSFRPARGEPAQSRAPSTGAAITVDYPGGSIVIHDLAPALRLGPRLAPAAAAAAADLPLRLGVRLPPMVAVVIAGDARTFAAAAQRDPRRLLGVARPGANLVVLNASRLEPGPEAGAEAVLRHELAHLALAQVEEKAGPLPRWFDEGAASWFAGGTAEQGPIDLALAAGASELSLSELTASFPEDPAQASRAYAKSQLAVSLLAARLRERGGTADLAALGAALATGASFEAALEATTGFDLAGLEAALRQRLLWREFLAAGLRQAQWGLGLAMALLAGLGYARYRVRLKRRLARWAQEESAGEAADAERSQGEPGGVGGEGRDRERRDSPPAESGGEGSPRT